MTDKHAISGAAVLFVIWLAYAAVKEWMRRHRAANPVDKALADSEPAQLPASVSPDVTGPVRTVDTPEPAPLNLGTSIAPPKLAAPSTPFVPLRLKRETEMQEREKSGLCLYCTHEATHGFPTPEFVRPVIDVGSLLAGDDLARHWRVRPRRYARLWERVLPWFDGTDVDAIVCEDHYKIARVQGNKLVAAMHAKHTEFIAAQTEDAAEFSRHGLDEIISEMNRAQSVKVKGSGT